MAKQKTLEEFIKESQNVHGTLYDYSKVVYVNCKISVEIICYKHGSFLQKPLKHTIRKHGCPTCGGSTRLGSEEFIKRAKLIHGNKYDYSLVKYKNKDTKIKIKCPVHGIFEIVPHNHIWQKTGCAKCGEAQSSKPEKEWIKSFNNPNIKSGIILRVDNKIIKPDGFDKTTNTVYEFHGDFYHGNPKIYDLFDIHRLNKQCIQKTYLKTLEREAFLRKNGFNVISIWEWDWNDLNNIKNRTEFTLESKSKNRLKLCRYFRLMDNLDDDYSFLINT
jgi:G:T-mismatch repair DNA endonuclease (very short patch repair protein)